MSLLGREDEGGRSGLSVLSHGGPRAYCVGVRSRRTFAVIALACGVALAVGAYVYTKPGGVPAAPPAVLLGVARDGGVSWLVRVAPVSLRPLPGRRLRLQSPLEAWALSPDGRRLAVVGDRASELRLIDVERMRTDGTLRIRGHGAPATVVWPRPDLLWIVLGRPSCCAGGSTAVVTVDPVGRRVVARRRIDGGLVRVAASADGPVLVLAPPAVIGPARLVTVDAAGAVAQLPLDGVSAGLMPTEGVPSVERLRVPGLAVDAGRRRAYVLSSRPYALEIDLRRMRVSGHRLVPQASLGDRLRELLEPTAEASDAQVGLVRDAAWIGAGQIALSGYDADAVWRPDGAIEGEQRPAGLHVIDTLEWQVRTLDERTSAFVAAAGLLLTTGSEGRGLAAYSTDGEERFHLLTDRHVEIVATAGSVAYVRTPPDPALQAIDLTHGSVLGKSAPGRATLLLERVGALRQGF
jgi:hypothetical protein